MQVPYFGCGRAFETQRLSACALIDSHASDYSWIEFPSSDYGRVFPAGLKQPTVIRARIDGQALSKLHMPVNFPEHRR